MLSGSIVAIVTPMAADGGLDLPRLKALAGFKPNYLHLGDRAAA